MMIHNVLILMEKIFFVNIFFNLIIARQLTQKLFIILIRKLHLDMIRIIILKIVIIKIRLNMNIIMIQNYLMKMRALLKK